MKDDHKKHDTQENSKDSVKPQAQAARKTRGRPKKASAKKAARAQGYTIGDYVEEQERRAAAGEDPTAAGEIEKAHMEAFQKMIDAAKINVAEIKPLADTACRSMFAAAADNYNGDTLKRFTEELQRILDAYQSMQERQAAFLKSDKWAAMKEALPELSEEDGRLIELTGLTDPVLDNLQLMKDSIAEYRQSHGGTLKLSRMLSDPDGDGRTLYENLTGSRGVMMGVMITDDLQEDTGTAARIRDGEPPAAARKVAKVAVRKTGLIQWPLDKLNGYMWQLLEEETSGQLTFAMEGRPISKTGQRNQPPKTIDLIYKIDFGALEESGVKTSKQLTPFDKLVYMAAAALYNAGNDIITLRQIFYAMGQPTTSNPKTEQLQKINDSLTKMARAWVTVDDRAEHEAYNYDIDEPKTGNKSRWKKGLYEGSLLPMERELIISGGKVTDKAIHLFREPPIMTFAKLRRQVTSLNIELLRAPISKTDTNLAIQDYLLTRIKRAANAGKCSEKILFKTLYDRTHITEKKAQQRTPVKIKKCISFYQGQGLIKTYEMNHDSVTVTF